MLRGWEFFAVVGIASLQTWAGGMALAQESPPGDRRTLHAAPSSHDFATLNWSETENFKLVQSTGVTLVEGVAPEESEATIEANARPVSVPANIERFAVAQVLEPIRIVDIQLTVGAEGVEVIAIVDEGVLPVPQTETVGNALVVEIPGTVLALPETEEFVVAEPTADIASIRAETSDRNTVIVTVAGVNAPPQADVGTEKGALTLNVTGGSATATEEGVDDAIEIVVVGRDEGYAVSEATTGTRTETPLRDIPQSVQVVPQEVLEDQQVIRLNDALRNVSGVVAGSNDPRGQRFTVRGFDSASVLRDGFRLTNGATGNIGFPELANVEQIEVLKGPAAVLYGASEPGGVINLVTERPLSEPFYELSFRAGNRSLIEPSIDLSGPLSEDGRALYRLNALYRRENYFRDFNQPIERFFFAPVLDLAINARTDVIMEVEYTNDERPSDFGLVAVGDEVADIPFDRALNDRDIAATTEVVRAGYRIEHRVTEDWTLRNAFSYNSFAPSAVVTIGPGLDEETGIVTNTPILLDQPAELYDLQTNVVGEFATGSVEHTLLAGVDLFLRRESDQEARGDLSVTNTLDIFDPDYSSRVIPDFDETPVILDTRSKTENLSVYVQDRVALLDNLKLLAGIRYDTVTQRTIQSSAFSPEETDTNRSDDAFSPRVGLVYQPIEPLSLYTSYSRSFTPNFGTTVEGDTLEPERGEQFEIGARAELLDGRFIANLALFNLVKENVATTDPDNPLFSVAVGEQRSRGVELDLSGELRPGWNIIANYAFLDTEITEDNGDLEGNELFGVPTHNVNLWTTYDIQSGPLSGLGFGLGVNYVGDRFGDNANSFTLDSYFLTNAAISYQQDSWELGLNFRNLFDIDYIESSENSRNSEINPGEGFTVIGSMSVEF